MNLERRSFDVAIVGAGVIGLASAWRVVQDGASVALIDRAHPGQQTSRVAAGMLAPVAEAAYGEERLLDLTMASAAAYPAFADELEAVTGRSIGMVASGALHVALDRDEAAELKRRRDFLSGLGLGVEWLGPSACRDLEPGLAPGFHGGMRVADEAFVDPRLLTAALAAALGLGNASTEGAPDLPVTFFSGETAELLDHDGRVAGVKLADGTVVEADQVVVATGSWAGSDPWLPSELRPPVRPVKGQILELAPRPGITGDEPVCSGIVATERVYLVPRADGRLIVGATVEEQGFDTTVTAGGVFELLREGYRALPELAEMELVEATAGLRPASRDNLPIIGPDSRLPGLVHATGHYRNGILLAPLTAQIVADAVAGRRGDPAFEHASPARFQQSADSSGATRDNTAAVRST